MDDPVSYTHIIWTAAPVWDWQLILWFGGIIVLLFCSAMTSGSEVAYFSLSQKELDEIPNIQVQKRVKKMLDHPKKLLATLLISNNAVNIAIVILSGTITGYFFADSETPDWLVFMIQVVLVTFLILLFGEVLPKVYAAKYPRFFIFYLNRVLAVLNVLFSWLSEPLIRSTNFIDKRIRKKMANSLSAGELSAVIDMTQDDSITEEEKKIWKGIVEFGTIEVKETMTPRTDVVSIDISLTYPEALQKITEAGYSRVPVYRDSFDKVEGILYIKDLLPHLEKPEYEWSNLLRPAYYVPENKKIDDLLKEFQAKKIHMAIVVDEYGGSSGIITLEDVIEEIVGEINDEFDDEQIVYSKLDDYNYVFEGKTPLINLCRILEMEYEEIESFVGDAESLAGLVLQLSGNLPAKNDVLDCNNLRFTIESVDKRRIKRVKVTRLNEAEKSHGKDSGKGPVMGIIMICLAIGLWSCDEPVYNPKPRGYFAIATPEPAYQPYDSLCPFKFQYSQYASIEPYQGEMEQPCWFNLYYPQYNATIHLTYNELDGNLKEYLDDAYKFAYNHAGKSSAISQNQFLFPEKDVYGVIYDLEGSPATTYQFFITDSTKHFFRGSLYFDYAPNYDSLQPVVRFLKHDIDKLVESFEWK